MSPAWHAAPLPAVATVVVVVDGAGEPARAGTSTALEVATTPVLDRLVDDGELVRARLVPEGALPGVETALPGLLGMPLDAVPGRGLLEAMAAGIAVPADAAAWRLDVRPPAELGPVRTAALEEALATLGGRVVPLGGGRHLLLGPRWWGDAPPGPHQTEASLATLARGPFAGIAKAAKAALRGSGGVRLRAWPWGGLGALPGPLPAPDDRLHLLTADGVAAAVGAVAGAVVHPIDPGGVGARVAAALDGGARVVVVHDDRVVLAASRGQPSGRVEDAHAEHGGGLAGKAVAAVHGGGPAATAAAMEGVDALVGSVAAGAAERGAALVVCSPYGCDPRSGRHDGVPGPALRWARPGGGAGGGARGGTATLAAPDGSSPLSPGSASGVGAWPGSGVGARTSPGPGGRRWTERHAAGARIVDPADLLAAPAKAGTRGSS